uniref:Deacetylase sirtuin-type domain-containing protein n=1 Tax=Syphacia muris TaxID=451379 RepID=A0A0N5APN8_9BILA
MSSLLRFVPRCQQPSEDAVKRFLDALHDVDRFVVLTGAGVSTESGIPDYRSEKVGQYARSKHRPINHNVFMASELSRMKYWARNFIGWSIFSKCEPNINHYEMAKWESSSKFVWLITQNVDKLHTKAGSKMLTELHGCGHRVRCMQCQRIYPREDVQNWIAENNPNWTVDKIGEVAPDGDIELSDEAIKSFKLPFCPHCGPKSILKTDVVFFGDFVPRKTVDFCYEKINECDGLLVVGSSLTVMSGYRFAYHASQRKIPIFIVNIGLTRADNLATVKLSARCSDVIPYISML